MWFLLYKFNSLYENQIMSNRYIEFLHHDNLKATSIIYIWYIYIFISWQYVYYGLFEINKLYPKTFRI